MVWGLMCGLLGKCGSGIVHSVPHREPPHLRPEAESQGHNLALTGRFFPSWLDVGCDGVVHSVPHREPPNPRARTPFALQSALNLRLRVWSFGVGGADPHAAFCFSIVSGAETMVLGVGFGVWVTRKPRP
jgi:hypothetical protein